MDASAGPGDLAARFEAAWNAHDMEAFAALFHEDATFVSRFGHYWRGRKPIVDEHAAIHASIYRETTTANEVQDVDIVADDVAVVHMRTRVTFGPSMPGGPGKMIGQFMYLASRRAGEWRIQAACNVAVTDPPTGQPVAEA